MNCLTCNKEFKRLHNKHNTCSYECESKLKAKKIKDYRIKYNWNKYQRKYRLKNKEKFKQYYKDYRNKNKTKLKQYMKEYHKSDKGKIALERAMDKYSKTDKYKQRKPKVDANRYIIKKIKWMKIVSGETKCIYCGCDVLEFLEFNHINGGGAKQQKKNRMSNLAGLSKGLVDPSELEVTCKICNNFCYLKSKIPELENKFKVEWLNEKQD